MLNNVRSAVPGAYPLPILDSYEQAVAAIPSLVLWVDPAKRATDRTNGMYFRDRVRGAVGKLSAASAGTSINSKPSFDFAANDALVFNVALPDSYTFALVGRIGAVTGTGFLLAGGFPNVTPGRVWFGVLGSSAPIGLRLDHAAAEGGDALSKNTSLALNTNYVLWASFDAGTKAAAIGINTFAAGATKTFTDGHVVSSQVCVGGRGSATTYALNGSVGPVLLFDKALHLSNYDGERTAALTYLANYSGVSMS